MRSAYLNFKDVEKDRRGRTPDDRTAVTGVCSRYYISPKPSSALQPKWIRRWSRGRSADRLWAPFLNRWRSDRTLTFMAVPPPWA